jgi:hypothetical protein
VVVFHSTTPIHIRQPAGLEGPEDVHIGQKVAVRFEQHDDVWIPLFDPTGETDPTDLVGEPKLALIRAPHTDDRFEHRSVISGIGRSRMGRRLMVDPLSLTIDACLAHTDAPRTWRADDENGPPPDPGDSDRGMS